MKLESFTDSLKQRWEIDTVKVSSAVSPTVDFQKSKNIEFKKAQIRRPKGLTIFILLLMILLSVKFAFFKGFWITEFLSLRGPFALDEWLESKTNIFDFYHISVRLINYFSLAMLIASILDFASITEFSFLELIRLFLLIAGISILRHIVVAIFAYLIQNRTVFYLHFRLNHLVHQVVSPFLYIAFLIGYFSNNITLKSWFITLCIGLLSVYFVFYLVLFVSKFLFNKNLNKFYLFFYLCTFEIIPVCLLINWLSKNLL